MLAKCILNVMTGFPCLPIIDGRDEIVEGEVYEVVAREFFGADENWIFLSLNGNISRPYHLSMFKVLPERFGSVIECTSPVEERLQLNKKYILIDEDIDTFKVEELDGGYVYGNFSKHRFTFVKEKVSPRLEIGKNENVGRRGGGFFAIYKNKKIEDFLNGGG